MNNTRYISYLQILTGVGIVLFWVIFFTIGLAPENAPSSYEDFEHSFPLPDAFLSLGLISGGVLTLRGNAVGRTISLASGGALIFLGLVDFSYNIQQGMYLLDPTNAFINIWSVCFGGWIIWRI